MTDTAILSLDRLSIGYDEPLVEPITLEVKPGEIIAILGPSGICLLYTSPSPRDRQKSRMPSSA